MKLDGYVVLDIETTITKYMGRKASPFSPDNWTVAVGWKFPKGKVEGAYYGEDRHGTDGLLRTLLESRPKLIATFNGKFDLLHLLKHEQDYAAYQEWVAAGGLVWDGQLAEYLLRGMEQSAHMLSLDEVAPLYGGSTKIDEVKALWEQGVNTHLIPRQLLMDYLTGRNGEGGDVDNTERIMLGQLKAARDLGMLNSLRLNMGALLASIEMERNGLFVNKELGLKRAAELEEKVAKLRAELNAELPQDLPFEFNWGSPKQRSALIFGGSVKYVDREPVLDANGNQAYAQKEVLARYAKGGLLVAEDNWFDYKDEEWDRYSGGQKKGQIKTKRVKVDDLSKPKFRNADFYYTFPGYTKGRREWEGSEAGVYSTRAEVIEELAGEGIPFLDKLAELTATQKDLGTYYITPDEKKPGEFKGMLTLVQPDGIVHHSINHTSTVTGRLSHSNPNSGNLPKESTSEVKQMFESRFPGGSIVTSDFKTLEIYVQAMMTGDKQLIADLLQGLDMHVARLSTVEGIPYDKLLVLCKGGVGPDGTIIHAVHEWEVKRTDIKVFSFQRAYGAGAAKIARGLKKDPELVQSWIDADEKRYPQIAAWNEKVAAIVNNSAVDTNTFVTHPLTKMRLRLRKGVYKSFDGKRYTFIEQTTPDWLAKRGTYQSFSPTEMKNYMVQGGGGEWMKAAMWLAVRAFYQYKNFGGLALLISTVHDALYADVDESVRRKAGVLVHASMLAASDLIEYLFGKPVPVPVPSDTGYGPSMYEESHFEDRDQFHEAAERARAWMRKQYMDGYQPTYLGNQ